MHCESFMGKAFIVCGSPGSGKSTHGKKLSQKHKATLLDVDTATERLVQRALLASGHEVLCGDNYYTGAKAGQISRPRSRATRYDKN